MDSGAFKPESILMNRLVMEQIITIFEDEKLKRGRKGT